MVRALEVRMQSHAVNSSPAAAARRAQVPSSSVRVVDEVAGLTAIFEPEVNVVVVRRALPEALVHEGQRLVREPSLHKLVTVAPGPAGSRALHAALEGCPQLAEDLGYWSEVLAELTGCERVGVRLARVEAAMCPRFHVDRVVLRAVCTYDGPGTEYVSNEVVDRRWLGHAAGGVPDEESGLLRVGDGARAARPGEVVWLKGEAWPGNAGRGAVHRSPAASADAPRLVMTLDAL
jgi:hypothetical protein